MSKEIQTKKEMFFWGSDVVYCGLIESVEI